MRHELFGNGQPGRLDRIERRIDVGQSKTSFDLEKLGTRTSDDIKELGEKMNRIMIAVTLLAGSSGAGIALVIKAMMGVG